MIAPALTQLTHGWPSDVEIRRGSQRIFSRLGTRKTYFCDVRYVTEEDGVRIEHAFRGEGSTPAEAERYAWTEYVRQPDY